MTKMYTYIFFIGTIVIIGLMRFQIGFLLIEMMNFLAKGLNVLRDIFHMLMLGQKFMKNSLNSHLVRVTLVHLIQLRIDGH